ncbi:hypothetical protein BGZ74_007957 [Mortierella antarctica]|nr:hypothetical protein BGZ74_007957 [Mortierella antarctica]
MASSWTGIPSTQPSCSSIILTAPTPHCPTIPSDPLGCFIQPTGLYCAPLATTRGFLYTLDVNPTTNASTPSSSSPPEQAPSIAAGAKVTLIPQLHIPPPPRNQSLLGVDGQPVKSQGPALLGQVCTAIPLPPRTHTVWPVLVAMANRRLNETVGFSEMGTGESVFALQGDCEPGAFCDTTASKATEGKGVCVGQLPNYHTCSSYFQCISLRCSQDHSLVKREEEEEEEEEEEGYYFQDVENGGRHVESVSPSSTRPSYHQRHHNKYPSSLTKRRVGSVCLPLSHELPGSGTGGGSGGNHGGAAPDLNSGDSGHHEIPDWAAAIIGGVLLVCILGGLVFIKRSRLKQQEMKRASLARQASGAAGGDNRERERRMSASSGFGIEKHEDLEYGYHAHPTTDATTTMQEMAAGRTVFSRWFGVSKRSAWKPSLPRSNSSDIKGRRRSLSTVASYRSNHSAPGGLDSAYSGGASVVGYGQYDATGVPSGHSSRRASSQWNVPRSASVPAIPQITTTLSETHQQIPPISRCETFSAAASGHERQSTDGSLAPAPTPASLTRFQEGEMPHETMDTPSNTYARLSTSSGVSSPKPNPTRMSHSPSNLSVPGSPISPISPISPMSPCMGTMGTSRLSSRSSYRHGST